MGKHSKDELEPDENSILPASEPTRLKAKSMKSLNGSDPFGLVHAKSISAEELRSYLQGMILWIHIATAY